MKIGLLYVQGNNFSMSEQFKNLVLLLVFSLLLNIAVVLGTCSPACVCTNDACVACDVGSYLESGSCYTCPAHCTSCNNSMVCSNCTEGYYGLLCEKNCFSSMCLNNTCNKDSGICLHGCIEGYFLSISLCFQCAADCKTCASNSNNCLECKEGYYGPSCQYSCSRCKDGICTKDTCTHGCGDGFYRGSETCNSCNKNCTSCSQFEKCHACVDGYFGSACKFNCIDCSPCYQNGSCPATTGPAPTLTTQPTSSTEMSVATSLPTTTIPSTKNRAPHNTTQLTSQSKQPVTTSPSQTSASQDSTSSGGRPSNSSQPPTNTPSNSEDNTLIIYAAAGGGGGLVVLVLVIVLVVVCKRRGKAKQSNSEVENMDMTENENYISADEIDIITRRSTYTQNEIKQDMQQDNDDLYSQPNKMHRPIMVTMET